MMHLFSRVYLSEIMNHQESAKMTFHFSSSLFGYKAFDILIELQSFPPALPDYYQILELVLLLLPPLWFVVCRQDAIQLEFVYASNVSMTIPE